MQVFLIAIDACTMQPMLEHLSDKLPQMPAFLEPWLHWFLIGVFSWILVESTIRWSAVVERNRRTIDQGLALIERSRNNRDIPSWTGAVSPFVTAILRFEFCILLASVRLGQSRLFRAAAVVSACGGIAMSAALLISR
jgi:hypothetical protein